MMGKGYTSNPITDGNYQYPLISCMSPCILAGFSLMQMMLPSNSEGLGMKKLDIHDR